ncbi:hypothetical protein [Clostridium weizhouense]|uniref:Uncharacterized protein n=1 Tax=Clostridium weizhouense TaxID=2859781 RepID=A0ABS7ALV3_9CLOT|nr:hypothetical protein [Clostridium weizhouense]MBW6409634.1 hypothetical protein [Clostridium weizhouense]
MKRISDFLLKIATLKTVIITIIITAMYTIFVFNKLIAKFGQVTEGAKVLDTYVGLNGDEAYKIISSYGDKGIKYYNIVQLGDVIFPILVGFTFCIIIASLIKKVFNGEKFKYLCILPFFTVTLFDYLENIGVFIMLRRFPSSLNGITEVTSFFSALKFLSYGVNLIIIVVLLLIYLKRVKFNR